jgi:hypothetical protein
MVRNRAIDASRHSFSSLCLLSCRFVKWGAIMYALANIDFSDRLGFIVSELTPDEIDRQDQTLDARQGVFGGGYYGRGRWW